ncbi:hypothetical protein DSECCO2_231090 [anaerobic digester metagenome]
MIHKMNHRQCENLTKGYIKKELCLDNDVVDEIINVLYEENVIRYKYTFNCPKCYEMDTIYEDEIEKDKGYCNLCSRDRDIDIYKLVGGSTIRYVLDKNDFLEFMEEKHKDILNESISNFNSKIVSFSKLSENIKEKESSNLNNTIKNKLFISHATTDVKYIKCFVEFLEDLGMVKDAIFCSSVEGYKLNWGEDIYTYIEKEFNDKDKNLIVLFMLSDNYYKSAACLNEMGAAWVKKNEYRSILLPGFEYKEIEGAINPKEIAIKFADSQIKYRLNDIKNYLSNKFILNNPDENKWDRIRDDFIEKIQKIIEEETCNNQGM